MAGLWSRTTMVIKSKYSKLLNRAENPTETLDYSYEQMLEQLQNVKRGTADVVTSKKRLELQQQKLEQNVVKLETQARQAVARTARTSPARRSSARRSPRRSCRTWTRRSRARGPAGEARRGAAAARDAHRVLPLAEGSPQGAVLGRRGPGQGRRGRDRDRPAHERHRAGHPARKDKTEEMQARASAIDELTSTGALEDFTAGDQTQLDRELAQISSASQVDDELAKLKAEVGSGEPQKEIAPGGEQPAPDAQPAPQPAEETTES
jgi:phage shock protein A